MTFSVQYFCIFLLAHKENEFFMNEKKNPIGGRLLLGKVRGLTI